MSETPDHVLKKIGEAREKQLKELDLSGDWEKATLKLTAIPPEVFELTQLEVLNLSRNSITSIPKAIDQLVNLRVLDLSANGLTSIPEAVGELKNLARLNLWVDITASVPMPSWIPQLKNLESLALVGSILLRFLNGLLNWKTSPH